MAFVMNDALRAHLDKRIERIMRKRNVKGVSAAIVGPEGTVYEMAIGHIDDAKTPNDPMKKMMIGSNTKTLTALAIMTLKDAGKLDLDADITEYLPLFKVQSAFAQTAITTRQILMHVSGLPCDSFAIITDERAQLGDILDFLAESALIAAPGTMPAYSNIGYGVLGLIIEACSGMPYAEYLQEAVCEPLGLSIEILETKAKRAAATSRISACFDKKGRVCEDPLSTIVSAGSNTYASLEDMAKLLGFFLNGATQTLLRPETLAEMLSFPEKGYADEREMRIGLGVMHHYYHFHNAQAGTLMGHGGSTATHHSCFHWLPKHRLGFTVMTNSEKGMFAAREIEIMMAVECLKALGIPMPRKRPPVAVKQSKRVLKTAEIYVGNGLKIPVKKDEAGHTEIKISFMRAQLEGTEDNFFRLKPKGLARFPLFSAILKRMRVAFTTVHKRHVMAFEQAVPYGCVVMAMAEAYEAVPVPKTWEDAVGAYDPDGASPTLSKTLKRFSISVVKGDLMLRMTLLGQTSAFHLQPRSEHEAVVSGYGRNAGETVRLEEETDHPKITFMGVRFKKR